MKNISLRTFLDLVSSTGMTGIVVRQPGDDDAVDDDEFDDGGDDDYNDDR